jgi:putative transposase
MRDITLHRTQKRWLNLAVVLDLARREEVGCAMRSSPAAGLTCTALTMTICRRRPAPRPLAHTDRAMQNIVEDYQELLVAHGGVSNMSRTDNYWSSVVAESFCTTIKGGCEDVSLESLGFLSNPGQ